MSINRGSDEDLVHIYSGLGDKKKSEIMAFAAT